MRRAIVANVVVLTVLIPAVLVFTGSAEILSLAPLTALYAGVLLLFARDWRLARFGLVVATNLLGVALVGLFGYPGQTHLLWVGTIPLVYALFGDDETRERNVALAIQVGLFAGAEVLGRAGLTPQVLPFDTRHFSALSVGLMFFMLVTRTRSLMEFNRVARQRLSDEQRRFSEAQATAHVGSFDLDLASKRMIWSHELFRLHGVDARRGVPTVVERLALVHTDDRAATDERLRAVLRANDDRERVHEYRIVRPDGEVRSVRWSGRRIADRTGRTVRITGCVQDVTERKHYEEALVRAREVAEQASRTKSMFLANMSHELRTPMNGVLGMTSLALETELDLEQREYLETALSSGQTLLAILNDILDLSKIEAGKLTLENLTFSVRTVVQQSMQLLAPRAQQKGLRFVSVVDDAVPARQSGDPVRVRQLLVNLLGNAVKFTHAGEVRVEIGCEGDDPERLVVKVVDTGVGIPRDRQRAIFDAFTQADGSTTRRFGGTGLGLTICRELVRLMKGSIDVESRVGEGSTFRVRVRLPVASQQVVDHGAVKVQRITGMHAAVTPRAMRVLLAEDNAVNARIATCLLERLGHTITHVTDGQLAVEALDRGGFDLVLMDIQMPTLDGLEATRIVRERELRRRGARVPIVAMTANAMKGDEEECLRAGMDDYLSKPINFEQLQQQVLRYARRAATTTTPASSAG